MADVISRVKFFSGIDKPRENVLFSARDMAEILWENSFFSGICDAESRKMIIFF